MPSRAQKSWFSKWSTLTAYIPVVTGVSTAGEALRTAALGHLTVAQLSRTGTRRTSHEHPPTRPAPRQGWTRLEHDSPPDQPLEWKSADDSLTDIRRNEDAHDYPVRTGALPLHGIRTQLPGLDSRGRHGRAQEDDLQRTDALRECQSQGTAAPAVSESYPGSIRFDGYSAAGGGIESGPRAICTVDCAIAAQLASSSASCSGVSVIRSWISPECWKRFRSPYFSGRRAFSRNSIRRSEPSSAANPRARARTCPVCPLLRGAGQPGAVSHRCVHRVVLNRTAPATSYSPGIPSPPGAGQAAVTLGTARTGVRNGVQLVAGSGWTTSSLGER
jgi:hypothetical protein